VAFAADDVFVRAWMIAHGENNGGTFDWDKRQWAKQ
jgi:hypothetical protein